MADGRVLELRLIGVILLCTVLLTGCASAIAVRVPKATSVPSCIAQAPDGDLLVGVALSGGGSRAAVFGAASLEALGRIRVPNGDSVLQHVAYISSVSGGSVATAYYAEHKPSRETPVLRPSGDYTEEYQKFFTKYHEQVSQNFEGPLIRRQLATFRWINSALAARSLEEVMREHLLGKATLGDLSARQLRGDIPAILFNSSFLPRRRPASGMKRPKRRMPGKRLPTREASSTSARTTQARQ